MHNLLRFAFLLALPLTAGAHPLLDEYSAAARHGDATFQASVERGQRFFSEKRKQSADLPSCATCHGAALSQEGRHAITGKRIAAMAPQVTPTRFSDRDKSEKWFRRNCQEVVGRPCTPAEKADVLAYALNGGRS